MKWSKILGLKNWKYNDNFNKLVNMTPEQDKNKTIMDLQI